MQANVKSVSLTPLPQAILLPLFSYIVLRIEFGPKLFLVYILESIRIKTSKNPKKKPYINGIYTTEYECMYVCMCVYAYIYVYNFRVHYLTIRVLKFKC